MVVKITASAEGLVAESGPLRLIVNDRLGFKPQLMKDGSYISPVSTEAPARPAFHLRLGGYLVDGFRADWNRVRISDFADSSGSGKEVALFATAEQYGKLLYPAVRVEQSLSLRFFDNLPGVVAAQATFTTRGERALSIDELVSFFFRLDRRLVNPDEPSWRFASYQGSAMRWGDDYSLVWTDAATDRENFMGFDPLRPGLGEGAGAPIVDLWTPRVGLAVASAEAEPVWASLPVRAAGDGLIEVSLNQKPEERFGQKTVLAPGESVSTLCSAMILHELDFHDALRSYTGLLRGHGVKIPLSSAEDCYRPYWKSWGFGLDFTLEQIYGALEEIKEFGIEMAMIDDGWFTTYGDWYVNPAPGKFPGGDKDMRAYVRRVKKAGFLTSIWWYPQGVSPESDLAAKHRDWLVTNQDGSLPVCQRKLHYLCPVYQPAMDYVVSLVEKFLGDWDYDGLYIDTTGLSAVPPCFNPVHAHHSPLDSFTGQSLLYRAIYETAQRIKPGCPVEMCVCSLPHDPFKMPYYNVANASDPVNLAQVRRRVKVEKAWRGGSFCVGDCYQIPFHEWDEWSCPQSFESAVGAGAQLTTLYSSLSPAQHAEWKHWFGLYKKLYLSRGEYLNLYDIAFDRPEGHVVARDGRLYYAFFAERWPRSRPIELRGLEPGKRYRVTDYANNVDFGIISGSQPTLNRAFAGSLLLEVAPKE
ncbi:MAG TPA: alpha-galactosidase [Candidatus Glassbacteria bacterium]|nr:alpha-galactosidase [Candidatus Glassbacteria bacterium]